MTTMKTKKYLTLAEAVTYSNIPHSTLRRKIRMGLLPAYKPGKCVLVEQKELDAFIKKAKQKFAS
jgi:excisionase family DNA binding protein